MSSIGEKIKEKLHIGHSSDDTPSTTAAEHTTKATSAQADAHRGSSAGTGMYGSSGAATSPATGTGLGSTAAAHSTPVTRMGTGTGTGTGTGGYTSTTKTPGNSPVGDTRPGTAGTTTGGPGTDQTSYNTSKTGTGGTTVCETTTCVKKDAGAQTTGAAATGGRGGAVCDTKYYTTVEDRPVEKEIVERVVEHHPVEKKFVVETRPAGEHELTHQRRDESLGTREEIKRVAPKSSPCEGGPELVVQQK